MIRLKSSDNPHCLHYSVTLGDESAKKRKVQKTVRERAGPPTFDCCIEMLDRHEWRIIDDMATATDRLLAGAAQHTTRNYMPVP